MLFKIRDSLDDVIPSHRVTLEGMGRPLPVRAERDVMDLGWCFTGLKYRDDVILRNDGRNPASARVVQPPATVDFFEFRPAAGFCLPRDTMRFSATFSCKEGVLEKCMKYVADGDGNLMEFPFKV